MADIAIRNISPDALARLRQGARARGITQAEYIERLLDLHDYCREYAATAGKSELAHQLDELGLQTVSA